MPGFYIASFPSTPFRYEIGYIDIKILLTNSPDIAVHFYIENELDNAKQLIEDIINFFKAKHDLESLPGKILINATLEELQDSILKCSKPVAKSSYFSWFGY